MKLSLILFAGDLKGLIQKTLNGSYASLLTSFMDNSRACANLKMLILLPDGFEITKDAGARVQQELENYCQTHDICSQVSLEQVSVKYAVLTIRVQDNNTVEFSTTPLKQYKRNIRKTLNRKKAAEVERKTGNTVWTKISNFFKKKRG